ncbi:MAG TPA: hypothetical protein VFB83_11390, partial [Propionibacteriaceae bacterium]|nr:hypothetical protein [Propionibacteriaceae bacterium]
MSEIDADQPAPEAHKAGKADGSQPQPVATEVSETDDGQVAASLPDDGEPLPLAHEASEISYDEQRYPARPSRLRPKGRLRDLFSLKPWAERTGKPGGDNPAYVSWLVERSMLEDAKRYATLFSGQGSMWQNPYANPDPRAAI